MRKMMRRTEFKKYRKSCNIISMFLILFMVPKSLQDLHKYHSHLRLLTTDLPQCFGFEVVDVAFSFCRLIYLYLVCSNIINITICKAWTYTKVGFSVICDSIIHGLRTLYNGLINKSYTSQSYYFKILQNIISTLYELVNRNIA